MDFPEHIRHLDWNALGAQIRKKTAADVEAALQNRRPDIPDLMALVSPAARPYLEQMASLSRQLTRQRFGRTVQFYIPLYLTNACINHCVYCGFSHGNKIGRIVLSDEQILAEVAAIKRIGDFQHLLLVTGEDPDEAGVSYIQNAVRLVKPYFSAISIEVQPLGEDEYRLLAGEGLSAVYCYQETYHRERYGFYHPKGPKSDFDYRLATSDHLGRAGIHKMGLGFLIGLEDWRTEAAVMAMHLRYLQKKYWQTKYSVSFPRMRPHEGSGFRPRVVMADSELAQIIFAFRIFDPDLEIALSTRENPVFRDNMATLGITAMSAGSKTDPGGYALYSNRLEQFSVNDDRPPAQIEKAIREQGYDILWKDWDLSLQDALE